MKFIILLTYCMIVFSASVCCQSSLFTSINIESSKPVRHDSSQRLSLLLPAADNAASQSSLSTMPGNEVKNTPVKTVRSKNAGVEQNYFGTKAAPEMLASFDGLGEGFVGPQGTAIFRNPSDNSLAVGLDHIVQIVNSRMAIFTKKGSRYNETGKVLYGPVETRNVFRGFGGPCERINNGDAVVRYDQLANRWLIVMPTFTRARSRHDSTVQLPQPGKAEMLFQPPPAPIDTAQRRGGPRPTPPEGSTYCMCYAISTGPDPFGPYYRYEFKRDLFPDYPRPAVWPDGYYTSTSTGDNVIERHAYVVDREKMLKGGEATEQSFIVKDVNFLINADLDGKQLPPPGAPNIMMATGGAQLKNIVNDDGIYVWKFHVDWQDPAKTKLDGPLKIPVEPYNYLCNGQLTKCVIQPGTDVRLDAQGDKLMARLVYRRIGKQESVVGLHSINTAAGGGGVRWYEFRVDNDRNVSLFQQGTYAPDSNYRWMGSAAMDGKGNIGIGYSFGGASHYPGQRFVGRLSGDKPGVLTLNEAILIEGEAAQTSTLRWEDYSQTAVDPSDDRTIWYVGDYLKKNAKNYTTRIGAFRIGK